MKIKVYFFGKERELTEEELELLKRIGYRAEVEIIALPQAGITDGEVCKKKEGEEILKRLENDRCVVALDEGGVTMDSMGFSSWLKGRLVDYGEVSFVIGGAYGLSEKVLTRADKTLSLGRMVWTRNLARHMVLEQIYRALEIDAGGNFHKV